MHANSRELRKLDNAQVHKSSLPGGCCCWVSSGRAALLIGTTLLHLLAVVTPRACGRTLPGAYAAIVIGSTAASVMWHGLKEPRGPWMGLDYALAALWAAADLWRATWGDALDDSETITVAPWPMAPHPSRLPLAAGVAAANAVVAAVNYTVGRCDSPGYAVRHAGWHLLSAAKAAAVAYALSCW
jgi:hypothetical protein